MGYLTLRIQYAIKVKLLGRPRRDSQLQVFYRYQQSVLVTRPTLKSCPERRVNFTEIGKAEVYLAAPNQESNGAYQGVSKFMVQCDREEVSCDSAIVLKSLIDNRKCQLPVECMIVRLFRVLKFRMDL